MSEPEDKKRAEVLQTKRLEIVDDEGKVRAALGTDEKGVTSLSVFDARGRYGPPWTRRRTQGMLAG